MGRGVSLKMVRGLLIVGPSANGTFAPFDAVVPGAVSAHDTFRVPRYVATASGVAVLPEDRGVDLFLGGQVPSRPLVDVAVAGPFACPGNSARRHGSMRRGGAWCSIPGFL